jgi:predicted GIY-YIG superfamily endonuclease
MTDIVPMPDIPKGWTLVRLVDPPRMNSHYVYRLYNEADDLLYVGCTNDPKTRRYGLKQTKDWWPEVARFRLTVYPNREHALRVEKSVIASEHPRYNVIGRPYLEVVG